MNSYDPYGPTPAPIDPEANAELRGRVQTPALFLLIVGLLNLVGALPVGVVGAVYMGLSSKKIEAILEKQNPDQWEEIQENNYTAADIKRYGTLFGLIGGGITALGGVIVILGGLRMMALKSYGLAISAAIVAALPCVSPSGCCLLGEAVGLWSLFVLLDAEVRAAFG